MKLIKIINYLKYFYSRRKKIISTLKKYRNFLEDGFYIIRPNYAYLVTFKSLFEVNLNNIFLKYIFRKKIMIHSSHKEFDGKLIFLNAQGDTKVFTETKVLTFGNKHSIKTLMKCYDKIELFFSYPKILEVADSYYIEEFIIDNKKKTFLELYSVYDLLFNFYNTQDYTMQNINTEKLCFTKLTLENKIFVESLIVNKTYFFINSHNDIHFGNIIKKEKLFIIDWEYFGKNLFFYDFLNILFIEALNGNTIFLDSFFNGSLDEKFNNLCLIFKYKYNVHSRMEYFNSYLLQKIILRDMSENKEHLNRVILRYKKVKEQYC